MLLGFISLLLTVFQNCISQICVAEHVVTNMLPCDLKDKTKEGHESNNATATEHFQRFFTSTISGTARRLLAEKSSESAVGYCAKKVTIHYFKHYCCFLLYILVIKTTRV